MSRLEEIFSIQNSKERVDELLEYARSLKLNLLGTKNSLGEYSESRLAVLIFDGERGMGEKKLQIAKLTIGFITVFLILGLTMFMLMNMKEEDIMDPVAMEEIESEGIEEETEAATLKKKEFSIKNFKSQVEGLSIQRK